MIRHRFLPVLTGLIAFMLLVMVGDQIVHMLYPMPETAAAGNKELMVQYLVALPEMAFGVLGLGWALAAFFAGIISARTSPRYWLVNAITTGAIATGFVILNLLLVPFHPTWFNIIMPLITMPLVYMGAKLLDKPKKVKPLS